MTFVCILVLLLRRHVHVRLDNVAGWHREDARDQKASGVMQFVHFDGRSFVRQWYRTKHNFRKPCVSSISTGSPALVGVAPRRKENTLNIQFEVSSKAKKSRATIERPRENGGLAERCSTSHIHPNGLCEVLVGALERQGGYLTRSCNFGGQHRTQHSATRSPSRRAHHLALQ